MINPSERDWTEDFSHENGNYNCRCFSCERTFIGHKRRVQCKVCNDRSVKAWAALTPEQQDEQKRQTAAKLAELWRSAQ